MTSSQFLMCNSYKWLSCIQSLIITSRVYYEANIMTSLQWCCQLCWYSTALVSQRSWVQIPSRPSKNRRNLLYCVACTCVKTINRFWKVHYIYTLMFNHCKTLFENGSCKINVHSLYVVRTAHSGNHYVFLHLHTLTFKENTCFQPQTPVNTLLYSGKMPMNKRKTSCLRCVNRAVNAGKWFVYLHLPRRKTTV